MATHSCVVTWRIPGTGEPDGLLSLGSHRVGHDWSDLAAAVAALTSDTNSKFKEFSEWLLHLITHYKDSQLWVIIGNRYRLKSDKDRHRAESRRVTQHWYVKIFTEHLLPTREFHSRLSVRVYNGASLCMHDWLINYLHAWIQFQVQLILNDPNHMMDHSVFFCLHSKIIRYCWLHPKIWHRPPPLTNALLLGMIWITS